MLTHGHGFTIYRSFPTVDTDADFTIFCLLSELEKWKDSHQQNFPQTWYIQIDGGSENANKYLLAALEYVVAKRLVQKIVLTRLPVGHTHEDIDACFGVIATWYGRHIVHTPQEYAEAIESAFGAESSKLKCKVVDVLLFQIIKISFPHPSIHISVEPINWSGRSTSTVSRLLLCLITFLMVSSSPTASIVVIEWS